MKTLVNEIKTDTYGDILKSDYLQDVFKVRNKDLDRLPNIPPPNDVRAFAGFGPRRKWEGDEIDVTLAMTFANIELRLAQLADCSDASTASPIGHLLKGKVEKVFEL